MIAAIPAGAVKRIHTVVKGRVQGVFFRVSTQQEARRLGLTGYARNLTNGAVEVEAQGQLKDLEQLLEFLQIGPPQAEVTELQTAWIEPVDGESDFLTR